MRVRVGSGPLWDVSLVPLSFFPRFPFGIRWTSDFLCFVDFLHEFSTIRVIFLGGRFVYFGLCGASLVARGSSIILGLASPPPRQGGWVVFLGTASALPFHPYTDGREMSKASQPASEKQSQFFLSSPSFTIKPLGVSIKISCG